MNRSIRKIGLSLAMFGALVVALHSPHIDGHSSQGSQHVCVLCRADISTPSSVPNAQQPVLLSVQNVVERDVPVFSLTVSPASRSRAPPVA